MPPATYEGFTPLVLVDLAPSGQHLFDKVWEKTAVGGILLLVTLAMGTVCWFLLKELKAEREQHRADSALKDEQLEKLNERFRSEMMATRQVTEGLIRQLEGLQAEVKHNNIRPEFQQGLIQLKNGLRALGEERGLRASEMNMDTGNVFEY